MTWDFLTLDDIDVKDKTVFVRLDINSPIDPETGRILDDSRIRAVIPTLRDLNSSRVVVGSHQSRPGKDDFIPLEEHASILRRYYGKSVKFINDVMGPAAKEAIQKMKNGEVLVLDNLRLCSEEVIEAQAKQLVKTIFIQRLAPLFDVFVNDAFAAAHRSQASLVGFAELMPSVAGRTMERELKALETVLSNPKRPCVYVLGGVKVDERLSVIENVLKSGKTDTVMVGGLLGEFFLQAAGYNLGAANIKKTAEFLKHLDKAKKILSTYKDKIVLPIDLAIKADGERKEVSTKNFPTENVSMDVGVETIARFCSIIKNAGTIVADGPLGVFEENSFSLGTKEVLRAIANSHAFTVVGGGHIAAAVEEMGLAGALNHTSTGGGAMLTLLSGQPMPAIDALKRAAKRYRGKSLTK
jgi:phosphoglycerate kinase